MGKVIGVAINKGGNGKTSLTTNLAGVIGKKLNKKVLIVDMDSQGSVAQTFGINPMELKDTIYDVLMSDMNPKNVIIELSNNVSLLPAGADMEFFDMDVLTNLNRYPKPFHLLKNALKNLADDYDYVFVDTPPAIGLVTSNMLVYCDSVLIPVILEPYSAKGLVRLLDTVKDFKESHNPSLEVSGVVGMMFDGRTNLHKNQLAIIKEYCDLKGVKFFDTVIPKSINFATSVAEDGQPSVWGKSNEITRSYTHLMREFIN